MVIVGYLLINGKTNINNVCDGKNQHYRTLLYYSNYLKDIFNNLFNEGKIVINTFDFSIGEGSDIVRSLHSDAVGDPITFLSVFIPEKYMPWFYLFNTFIRVYLAGIFFSMLCFYLKQDNIYAILAGAITYSFCFWSLESITMHIYFLTPLMYMPLIILGIEKIINDDKPYIYIVSIFFAAISWLYFFYMEACATAIYGLIRIISKYKNDIKQIIKKLLIIIGYTLIALLLASFILIPMLYAYIGDNRMNIDNNLNILYPRFFYERLFTIFVSNDCPYDLYMGFVAPSAITLLLAIKNFKKNKCLSIFNILCIVFACLPICGKILNGFSFVSQRWSFIIALPISYNMVQEWNEFKKEKKYILIFSILMICASLISPWSRTERVFVPIIFSIMFYVIATEGIIKIKTKYKNIILIAILCLNVLYIYDYNMSERGGDRLADMLSIEKAYDLTSSTEAYAMKTLVLEEDNNDFYRYTGNHLTNNSAMNFDVNSTNYYFSITNNFDQQFRKELGLVDTICWQINGYDNKASLESLANVKYYICESDYNGVLPYGFEYYKTINGYSIYKNNYALPFGYTYDSSISYDTWQEYNLIEKQEALLHSIVLNDNKNNSYEIGNNISDIEYNISCENGISINENEIIVDDPNALITIKLNNTLTNDNYFCITGLKFNDIYGMVEDDHTESIIQIQANDGTKMTYNYLTKDHHYYFGKKDYAFYFGNKNEIDEFTLKFSLPGEYSFDEIRIASVSLDEYEKNISNLSQNYLQNVNYENNTLTGTINVDDDKYMLLSIPYSSGWKAFVDGKEVELLQANIYYCGIELSAGNHDIKLIYSTPGLRIGVIISSVSTIAVILYILIKRKKKNETNNII